MEPTVSQTFGHLLFAYEDGLEEMRYSGLPNKAAEARGELCNFVASLEADRAVLEWLLANPGGLQQSANTWVAWTVGATGYATGYSQREAITNCLNHNLHPLPQGTPTL